MTERVIHHKKVYKQIVKDEDFLEWLRKKPKAIRVEVHALVCSPLYFCEYYEYNIEHYIL